MIHDGRIFLPETPRKIVISIRRNGLALAVDGKKVADWRGSWLRVSSTRITPENRSLFLGTIWATWRVTKVSLRPVTGKGHVILD